MALAVKKAGGPYPRAYGKLGLALLLTGDQKGAEQNIKTALEQDTNEIISRIARVIIVLNGHRAMNIASSSDISGMIIGPLISFGFAADSHGKIRQQIRGLVEAWRHLTKNENDVEEWLAVANFLIIIGDHIGEIQMIGGRPNLYIEVVNAPWDRLDKTNHEKEISDIRRKAEGRALLFK